MFFFRSMFFLEKKITKKRARFLSHITRPALLHSPAYRCSIYLKTRFITFFLSSWLPLCSLLHNTKIVQYISLKLFGHHNALLHFILFIRFIQFSKFVYCNINLICLNIWFFILTYFFKNLFSVTYTSYKRTQKRKYITITFGIETFAKAYIQKKIVTNI